MAAEESEVGVGVGLSTAVTTGAIAEGKLARLTESVVGTVSRPTLVFPRMDCVPNSSGVAMTTTAVRTSASKKPFIH